MPTDFASELARRLRGGAAPAVLGLDPRLEALPADIAPGAPPAVRIEEFYARVLPRVAPHACAVKPNIAFFERHGADGWRAYEATCAAAHAAGLLVIGDVKRGDIGPTAQAYADAHFRLADALTLHPYLGSDAIEPFLGPCRTAGKGVFVLVRTSNASAHELQDLPTAGGTVSEQVARLVDRWGKGIGPERGYGPVGAVVGATCPDQIAALRALMPRAWFLLPGVGAQGGKVADLRLAFGADGLGALVAQSRGILQCFEPAATDWLRRVVTAAEQFAGELRRLLSR
jgi:orotidine-5'-phosphate decarboxylase